MNYGAGASANNSLMKPQFVLKLSMVTFLAVQAIRQLVLVNGQAEDKKETRSGQVAAWMTIILTLIVAVFLYPSTPLPDKNVLGGLFLLFAGAMGSGITMLYDALQNKAASKAAEPNRMWFAIAHIIFAIVLLAFLLFTLTK